MKRLWSVLGCAIVFSLPACGGPHSTTQSHAPKPKPKPTVAPVSLRAQRSGTHPVSILVVSRGKKLYTIAADSNDSRRLADGTYLSHFANPAIVFFDKDGKEMHGYSTTADVNGKTKEVTMHDNVRLISDDGTVLTCTTLLFDDVTEQVHGTGAVEVKTTGGDTLRGARIDGDVRLREVHIRQNAP